MSSEIKGACRAAVQKVITGRRGLTLERDAGVECLEGRDGGEEGVRWKDCLILGMGWLGASKNPQIAQACIRL